MINHGAKNCHYSAVKNLSELNSLGWLRGKKEAIINDDNSFQNALNDALNYQTIETHPERMSKIKSYIIKYNWEGIEFPTGPKDWKIFEQNNKTTALNILFVPHNIETIRVAYRSEYNRKRKNNVNFLMITDGTKWRYLAITNMSTLLEGKSSDHHRDFYCIQMSKCFEKILKYNPGKKSLKAPFEIYLDLECLLKKKKLLKKIPKNRT